MRIVALGAGESGVGAAVLAKKEGYDVFVSDAGTISEKYRTLLTQHDIPFEDGGHTESLVLNADEIVKSPGIPEDAPMVKAVREKGIPVISEIEFAARYTDAKMICITGSNGKTTTTSWIFHIMKKAGTDVGLAGNIGRSLALQVAEDPHACYVIELSSFQLDDMFDFRADIAVLLNITPDHLDRYNFELQNYVDSKMRITRNQRPSDSFIYYRSAMRRRTAAKVLFRTALCGFQPLRTLRCPLPTSRSSAATTCATQWRRQWLASLPECPQVLCAKVWQTFPACPTASKRCAPWAAHYSSTTPKPPT